MALTKSRRVTQHLMAGGLAVLLAAMVIGAFVAGRWTAPEDAPVVPVSDEQEETTDAGGEQIYYCSMHPDQQSTDPDDTCPICGMDLVPMPDDGAEDDRDLPVLRVSDRAQRLMEIETTPVERRAVEKEVRFVGQLAEDERVTRDVVARSDGYIERLHADYTWQPIEAGDVLAEIDSPAVSAAARELLLIVRGDGGRGGASLDAARARLDRLGVSDDQVERIIDTGEVPRTYELRSPVDGVVREIVAREGDGVRDGQRVLRVTDLSTLWLSLEAFESDLQWIEPGQSATFTVQTWPGRSFEGQVSFVNPVVDDRTRTARVRLDVPNVEGRLKPGMFARGRVMASSEIEGEPPLVIPRSAALMTGRRAVVYVKEQDTDRPTFEGRQVTLGARLGDHHIVEEGLEEGERVVTRGAFKIDSELQIRGRPSMMSRLDRFEADDSEPKDAPDPFHDHAAYDIDPGDIPASFAQEAAQGFEHYLAIVAALAEDDPGAAREAVTDFHDHLLALSTDALEQAQHEAWAAVDADLHEPLHAMAAAEDLEGMRAHLEPLTDATHLLVVAFAADHVDAAYRLNCPMAFDNEGADWLQADREVANAYFGASMLRCGSVEQDLLADGEARADDQASSSSPAGDHQHE